MPPNELGAANYSRWSLRSLLVIVALCLSGLQTDVEQKLVLGGENGIRDNERGSCDLDLKPLMRSMCFRTRNSTQPLVELNPVFRSLQVRENPGPIIAPANVKLRDFRQRPKKNNGVIDHRRT